MRTLRGRIPASEFRPVYWDYRRNSDDIFLLPDAEDLHVLVIDIHHPAGLVVQLQTDRNVVVDVAQEFFAAIERIVRLLHIGNVGQQTDNLVFPCGIENGVNEFAGYREPVVLFDIVIRSERSGQQRQRIGHVPSQFAALFSDISLPRQLEDRLGGVVGVENLVIDRISRIFVQNLEPDITQRHIPIEILQVIAFGLRLFPGPLQLDADIDDVGQRGEPLAIFITPRAMPFYDVNPT